LRIFNDGSQPEYTGNDDAGVQCFIKENTFIELDGACVRSDADTIDSTAMDALITGVECKLACANDSTCALAEWDGACYHKLFPDGLQTASYAGDDTADKKCYVPKRATAAEEYNWTSQHDIPDSDLGTLTIVEEITLNPLERITEVVTTQIGGAYMIIEGNCMDIDGNGISEMEALAVPTATLHTWDAATDTSELNNDMYDECYGACNDDAACKAWTIND
jgi:hypothetical protein